MKHFAGATCNAGFDADWNDLILKELRDERLASKLPSANGALVEGRLR